MSDGQELPEEFPKKIPHLQKGTLKLDKNFKLPPSRHFLRIIYKVLFGSN